MPRLVNDEYIVSIGSQPEFHSSMDFALRAANADMLHWLTSEYKLTAPEANLLFGTVVQHKIEIAGLNIIQLRPDNRALTEQREYQQRHKDQFEQSMPLRHKDCRIDWRGDIPSMS